MTDLERYVRADGRDELVKQVRSRIDELGISYIYYQFISVTGRIVGKGVPADHWETIAERGFQLVYGATANLFVDRHGNYIGYGPEASELVGIPDPETFVQLPWDKHVARVFCTCFRNREEEVNPGGFLTSDCRGNLRRIHEQFKKDHQNRTCRLRVSAPGRFEYRAVDSTVNPYLLSAALLKAFDDGIKRKLDPGEPEYRNIYEAVKEGKEARKIPMSLGEALDKFEQNEVIKSALPDEMYQVFMHYKRDEWERYLATVTEWDIERYLDVLP